MSSVDLETLEQRFEFGINARPTLWTRSSQSAAVMEFGRPRWPELHRPCPLLPHLTVPHPKHLAVPRALELPVFAKL